MKKIICSNIFRLVTAVFTLYIISSILIVSGYAADGSAGLRFLKDSPYEGGQSKIELPLTYEATVYFSADYSADERGGVILGSYDTVNMYCINFEIHKKGNPRLYIISVEGVKYDVIFDKINVYNGKYTHIAITLDRENSVWSCYIDGQLKQTINRDVPKSFMHTKRFCLGADNRDNNGQFFKGVLKNLALASEMRSADQISKDCDASTRDISSLKVFYDLSSYKPGETPPTVKCNNGNGPSFKFNSTWFINKKPLSDYAYSFAVFGDTQSITEDYPSKLGMLYDWVLDNKDEKKIEFVIGLGDMVDNYTVISEWQTVENAITRLDGKIGYSIVRGNHDNINLFMDYFPLSRYKNVIDGSYDNTTMLNTYQIFTVGEVKYLVMSLDIILSDDVLNWAGKVIERNKDCNVIVTTHNYIHANGNYEPELKYGAKNTGSELWEKLISKYENIVLTLCGHSPTDKLLVRKDLGDNGNTVTQILIDPQVMDKDWDGGTGMVTMFYFSEDGSEVQVEFYSILKEAYYLSSNQFELQLSVVDSEGKVYAPGEKNKAEETEPNKPAIVPIESSDASNDATPLESDTRNNGKAENNNVYIVTAVCVLVVVIALGLLFVGLRKKKGP